MIPKKPGEQCAHARDILAAEDNAGFMNGELTQILVYWLDLEAHVLAVHVYPDDMVEQLPSVRLARWVMRTAGCYDAS